jgi:carboxymethylenebutenolidase
MRFIVSLGICMIVNSTVQADKSQPISEAKTRFVSGGKSIAVEEFSPREKGKLPTLLLLHGSDGLAKRGDDYRTACRAIARRGYVVLLVHYFDRSGTTYATRDEIDKHFFAWVGVIHDALGWAAKLPHTDATRIGLVGYSLGGYLSLSSSALAFKKEHRAAVIVEYFGGLPKLLGFAAKALPPVLILHGRKDTIVPVKEAMELEERLRAAGVPYEIKIYEGQGHGFDEKNGQDAMERGFRFLEKYLIPGSMKK